MSLGEPLRSLRNIALLSAFIASNTRLNVVNSPTSVQAARPDSSGIITLYKSPDLEAQIDLAKTLLNRLDLRCEPKDIMVIKSNGAFLFNFPAENCLNPEVIAKIQSPETHQDILALQFLFDDSPILPASPESGILWEWYNTAYLLKVSDKYNYGVNGDIFQVFSYPADFNPSNFGYNLSQAFGIRSPGTYGLGLLHRISKKNPQLGLQQASSNVYALMGGEGDDDLGNNIMSWNFQVGYRISLPLIQR